MKTRSREIAKILIRPRGVSLILTGHWPFVFPGKTNDPWNNTLGLPVTWLQNLLISVLTTQKADALTGREIYFISAY